ncbi:MAG: hypothetical protein QY309_03800 [Cyclobacteriaceae bacterium]|nr:MAG: hypothetical protein QY309_03800 [Cyclobacteriaceae bacterium]
MRLKPGQIFLFLLFDFLIPAGMGYLAFTNYPDGDWKIFAGIAIASLVFSFVLMFSFWSQFKVAQKNDPIRQKIASLRASGQELHMNREDVLTGEDIAILNKYLKSTLLIVTIVLGILALLFGILGEDMVKLVGLASLIGIYPIRKYFSKDMERVITGRKKRVTRGIITDRFTTTSGSGKSKSTDYWLTIGDVKLKVARAKYTAYQVGEAAEFHTVDYPKGSVFVLRDEKLEGAGLK